jgi:hypothetical protein
MSFGPVESGWRTHGREIFQALTRGKMDGKGLPLLKNIRRILMGCMIYQEMCGSGAPTGIDRIPIQRILGEEWFVIRKVRRRVSIQRSLRPKKECIVGVRFSVRTSFVPDIF